MATIFALSSLSGCSGILSGQIFKERAAETPAPEDMNVDKSFFVDPNGKPKTFLCAYAPEVAKGWGEYMNTPLVNETPHCNVEFEITENYLIGKRVDPSYPDQRSRWAEILRIPIEKHYYYERNKDSHGRETNEWIENSSRSHWSARPKMKLNLNGLEMILTEGGLSYRVTSVEEIEWDKENNFLGFSAHTVYKWEDYDGSLVDGGVKFRVNFLKFDHDPTFKKVPYNEENARYMNVLHVMGRTIEGHEKDLYAAHWDVRKPTRIYINAPKEYQPAIVKAVYDWNAEFVKIGAVPAGQLAFAPVIKELKHPFDLRYPSITWISDRKISANAPLGIGMAHADVRNGKIIWGAVVMFGGILETYINAYAPVESSPAAKGGRPGSIPQLDALTQLFPQSLPPISILQPNTTVMNTQSVRNGLLVEKNYLNNEIINLAAQTDPKLKAQGEALRVQLLHMQNQNPDLAKILTDIDANLIVQSGKASDYSRTRDMRQLFGTLSPGRNDESLAGMIDKKGQPKLAKALREKDPEKRRTLIQESAFNGSAIFAERELTIENKVGSWMNSPAQKQRGFNEILDSVVAALTIHEIGHVLGLGHQFKENIVPKAGTVPSRYVKALSEKAKAENEFTNMTSVMGYQSGRSEVMTPAEDYVPGPQDNLVLRYLYRGEYAAYNKEKDDFAFIPVPVSGKIPMTTNAEGSILPTSYFPQCNDYEATFMADPFCNRFDRGNKAEEIVNSYFELISDNILASMYSVVGASGNQRAAEWRLWYRSLDTMSRVRIFYDEMRRRLRSEPHLKGLWNQLRNDTPSLMEFAKGCMEPVPTDPALVASPILRKIFEDEEIVDLCRANKAALKEYEFFMNMPESDYTRIDHKNRYVLGGYLAGDAIRDFGHRFGSWYQLTNLPLKLSSIYALTTSDSFLPWLWPNPYYNTEENRFQYRTLYPFDYTRMISKMVSNNMRFAAGGKDDATVIGRPVLAASMLMMMGRYTSNDSSKLPGEYVKMLNQQTSFNYSMVAILIDAQKPDASSNVKADHYKKFTGQVYDFFSQSNKTTTARDVFLLPNGDVFVWAPGMFLFPITKIKFYSGTSAYVLAYKVDYDQGPRDPLYPVSLKAELQEKNNKIGEACVMGFDSSGLESYFDTANQNFAGFKILSGIATESGNEKLGAFYDSLKEEFDKYEETANKKIPASYPIKSMTRVCDEAIRGMGQISAAAAIANGVFLGITPDYLEN